MRSPVVTNALKLEDSDDVDKIYFVLAQAIARARGETDLKKRVEAMETANAIAEAKLKAAQAKIIEKEESAMNSKFSDNHIVTELDEKVAYDEELSASIIKQIKELGYECYFLNNHFLLEVVNQQNIKNISNNNFIFK